MRVRVMLVRDGRGRRDDIVLDTPEAAFAFLRPKFHGLDREHLLRVDLGARNQVLGFETVSIGTLTASLVHPREVFRAAILGCAAGVILAHNHPSGDCSPSSEDRETTRRIKAAGDLLGVPMIDHVIVAGERFYSFRQAGLL